MKLTWTRSPMALVLNNDYQAPREARLPDGTLLQIAYFAPGRPPYWQCYRSYRNRGPMRPMSRWDLVEGVAAPTLDEVKVAAERYADELLPLHALADA